MDSQNEKKVSPFSGFIDYVELFVVAICVVILLFSLSTFSLTEISLIYSITIAHPLTCSL